ncbi:hypothetical protein [Prosthecobacter sp.]|uniref:hypothetical protein n=1 Tax=Prosthecobacter sp. TaxID=1965333 RepID=UPI002AB8A198|nr:hypothetical protein [Prosthecobacter sp.]MDZ4401414.1 hypothetical protein [Prosthecobacter sp.]
MSLIRSLLAGSCALLFTASTLHAELRAGVARIDITDRTGPVNDPCFAKALVLKSGETTAVLITVDAVAIGEIGRIGNGFLATVRGQLEKEAGISPSSVVINASHCHGIIRADTAQLVVQVVKEAAKKLLPVKVGSGSSLENRISENRRIKMKDGSEVDMRRAYSMPRDEDVAGVGPIDPQIGLLRLDREDGSVLAVIYNFACHPIMNPPHKGSSADFPGYASKTIEEALGGGAMAFFIQGCGGDINPVRYKEVNNPASAEPLGTMLGASVLATARQIKTADDSTLKVSNATISLPRAADYEKRIATIETEQKKLLAALKPTNINFKSFLPLLIQHKLWPDFPSHHSQSYLHDQSLERKAISQLDADNRASVEAYLQNLTVMEQLTRLNTNLALLKRHLAETKAAAKPTLDVEICGLRIGDFKLVTFPGELTVQIGLNIKKAAQDANAFVAGYTNGYIYYTPTVEQRTNTGYAQEDCDTLVAPEWQKIFETKALEVLQNLAR